MNNKLNILIDNNRYNTNDWELVFNYIAQVFSYKIFKFGTIHSLLVSDVYLTFAPTYRILIAKLFGVKIIFVNWQYPLLKFTPYKLLKYLKLMFYVYLTNIVISNDANKKIIFKKHIEFLPKPVNLEFFNSHISVDKFYDFIIPGDAERDLGLIDDLIQNDNLRIARISRNFEAYKYNNVDFFHNLSYYDYKKLILSSKMGVLPLKHSNHLAGQSVLLELLACNLPVYISMGYTYMAFKNYENVFLLDEKAIKDLQNRDNSNIKYYSSKSIDHHSIHSVSVRLNEIILKCLIIK